MNRDIGVVAHKVQFETVCVVPAWFEGVDPTPVHLQHCGSTGLERYVGVHADDGAILVEVSVIKVGSGESAETGGHSQG